MAAKLTDKQRKFAELVASGCEHWRAYRTAYDAENMSCDSVHTEAYRTLRLPQVEQYLNELRSAACEYAKLDSGRIYERMAELNKTAYEQLKNDPQSPAAMRVFVDTSDRLLKALGSRESQPSKYTFNDWIDGS